MYGIVWSVGAIVVGSSAFVGTFNGAHMLGLMLMLGATVAWWRKDAAAWRRVDTVVIRGELRHMNTEPDFDALMARKMGRR